MNATFIHAEEGAAMMSEILNIRNLVYSSGMTAVLGNQLLAEMGNILPEGETRLCDSIHSLAYLLLPLRSRAASREMIAVLIVTCEEELQGVYEFRELLENINLIIVIPEDSQDLAAMAKDLHPCLTTSGIDLSPVLEEIANLWKRWSPLFGQPEYGNKP